MRESLWWAVEYGPGPDGRPVPTLGGRTLPDGASVELLLGGACVAGTLHARGGRLATINLVLTDPAGEPCGTQFNLTVTEGCFLRPCPKDRVPQEREGGGVSPALAGRIAEGAADAAELLQLVDQVEEELAAQTVMVVMPDGTRVPLDEAEELARRELAGEAGSAEA